MNILLVNENPVVTKLVTLSAQKTQDHLESVTSVDDYTGNACDLLIIDDGLYDAAVLSELREKCGCQKVLFMASRGTEKPADAELMITKPFLPTDLVDLFAGFEPAPSAPSVFDELGGADEGSAFDELSLDDISDAESMLDDSPLLSDMDDMLGDLEELEDLDVLADDTEDSIDDDVLGLESTDEDALDHGILDKDDLEEVQHLLEDTESIDTLESEEESGPDLDDEVGSETVSLTEFDKELEAMSNEGKNPAEPTALSSDIDDLLEDDDLGLDTAVGDALEEVEAELELDDGTMAFDHEDEIAREEESALPEDEEAVDLQEKTDLEAAQIPSVDETDLDLDEANFAGLEMDDLLGEEAEAATEPEDEFDIDALSEISAEEASGPDALEMEDDLSLDLLDEEGLDGLDEAITAQADALEEEGGDELDALEAEIQNAVEGLSEEDLAAPVDEAMLLDLVNDEMDDEALETMNLPDEMDELSAGLDELDALSEHDLMVAVGEADETEAIAEPDELDTEIESETEEEALIPSAPAPAAEPVTETIQPKEGLAALEKLVSALNNEEVVKSLKGLNISINISFGEED